MQDRLQELKKYAVESTAVEETSAGELGEKFTLKVRFIQDALTTVKSNNEQITSLKEKHTAATLNAHEKEISGQLKTLLDENNAILQKVKQQMTTLHDEVEDCKDKAPNEPETRMKTTSYQALSNKFSDVLKESQNIQVSFKAAVREKITRQAKIIDDKLTEDQIEEICNDPEGSSRLLASKTYGQGHIRLQNTVSDIQDKYKDIKRLEASVQVVYQMLVDMAMLVQHQGELVDNIELNINTAQNYVEKAEKKLQKAKRDHIASRKKMCIILICLAIIVFIILASVFI